VDFLRAEIKAGQFLSEVDKPPGSRIGWISLALGLVGLEAGLYVEEEADQFGLAVGCGFLEHALQVNAHCRQRDTKLAGDRLQPLTAQYSDGNRGFRRCEAIELLQVMRKDAPCIVGINDNSNNARMTAGEFASRLSHRQDVDDEGPSGREPRDRLDAAGWHAATGKSLRDQALQGDVVRGPRGAQSFGADSQTVGLRTEPNGGIVGEEDLATGFE